jgi:hypothetical protein
MSIHGGRIIDSYSLDSHSLGHDLSGDAVSVRFRAVAEILLRGINRCVAADREVQCDSERSTNTNEQVLDNLGDSLPKSLDFVSDKPLSVSDVSKTPGFGDAKDIQNGGNS